MFYQAYSDQKREEIETALPNIETFYLSKRDIESGEWCDLDICSVGWYYWYCFPGCLPDTDPIGPFDSQEEALQDAREDI